MQGFSLFDKPFQHLDGSAIGLSGNCPMVHLYIRGPAAMDEVVCQLLSLVHAYQTILVTSRLRSVHLYYFVRNTS